MPHWSRLYCWTLHTRLLKLRASADCSCWRDGGHHVRERNNEKTRLSVGNKTPIVPSAAGGRPRRRRHFSNAPVTCSTAHLRYLSTIISGASATRSTSFPCFSRTIKGRITQESSQLQDHAVADRCSYDWRPLIVGVSNMVRGRVTQR